MFKITQELVKQSILLKNVHKFSYIPITRHFCDVKSAPSDFQPVYKFNHIRGFALINRLKWQLTVLNGLSIPISLGLTELNYLQKDIVTTHIILGLAGTVFIYLVGFLPYNLVGFIYYNEKTDEVKLSYADFWGRRKDVIVSASDIISISTLPPSQTNNKLYVTLERYSTQDKLKVFLKYGEILNEKQFSRAV